MMRQILKINLLGDFIIEYGENLVTDQSNRSKKIWSLLEYLVVNRDRFVPQEELIGLYWADGGSSDPINTLKVLMHRVRTTLGDLNHENGGQLILYKRGGYGWNPKNAYEVDIDEFERLIQLAEAQENDTFRKTELLLQAESIYKGDFLQKNASEAWIVPYAEHYRTIYGDLVAKVSELLIEQKRYDELIVLCKKAVKFHPYNEDLYLSLIHSYLKTGQQDKALEQYQYVSELFFREFGLTPSPTLVKVYREIIKTIKSPEMNLSVIQEYLNEEESAMGCLFCEYEIFKSIFQLQKRSLTRTGESIHIALISVTDKNKSVVPSSQKLLNRSMDYLKGSITHSLRRCDVFTRYSVNQYLILLPTTTYDTASLVMNRVVKAFNKDHPNPNIKLRFATQPIIPEEVFIKPDKGISESIEITE